MAAILLFLVATAMGAADARAETSGSPSVLTVAAAENSPETQAVR